MHFLCGPLDAALPPETWLGPPDWIAEVVVGSRLVTGIRSAAGKGRAIAYANLIPA